ncbi:MAG: hypothetical protein P8Z78_06670 [Gammaproteobacteria bacterium]
MWFFIIRPESNRAKWPDIRFAKDDDTFGRIIDEPALQSQPGFYELFGICRSAESLPESLFKEGITAD